ncbi:MAG: hypothetical protein ACI4NA_01805, partial [Succinivibrio sp.]
IKEKYPEMPADDADTIAKAVVSAMVIKAIHPVQKDDGDKDLATASATKTSEDGVEEPGRQTDLNLPNDQGNDNETETPERPVIEVDEDNTAILKFKDKLINVDDLNFSLIESINPFGGAYRFISRNIDPSLLATIRDKLEAKRSKVTENEALMLWSYIKDFVRDNGRYPSLQSSSDFERRLAQVLAYVRERKREAVAANSASSEVQS